MPEFIVGSSLFAGLSPEEEEEERARWIALGATIREDGDYLARMEAAANENHESRLGWFGRRK